MLRGLVQLGLLFLAFGRQVSAFLDVYIDGLPNRIYPNVSLGLDRAGNAEEHGHQCTKEDSLFVKENKNREPHRMSYTANRRLQEDTLEDATQQHLQMAFVLAVGGHNMGVYNYGASGSLNGLASVWDSWVDYFFTQTSNTTSVILLLDERDFRKQNFTRSKDKYLDAVFMDNFGAEPVDCVQLQDPKDPTFKSPSSQVTKMHKEGKKIHKKAHHFNRKSEIRKPIPGCTNLLQLGQDENYRVYYIDVGAHPNATSPNQAPFVIFASVRAFPNPAWANVKSDEDEDTLDVHWRPKGLSSRFTTNYAYVKMTNWYAYHLLELKLLDYFDYVGKIDSDVSFLAPFPEPNIPGRMAKGKRKAFATQKEWYHDDPRIQNGVEPCLYSFMEKESKLCDYKKDHFVPASEADQTFWGGGGPNLNTTFRSHFVAFWLGLYTAPETKLLARHWNDYEPHGMWHFRWGDQQWWPRPLAMFDNASITESIELWTEIDSDNDKYVKHKAYPLSATLATTKYFNFSGSTAQKRKQLFDLNSKKFIY